MALHGDVRINGVDIGTNWSARRIAGSQYENGGLCRYRCAVRAQGQVMDFEIEHYYQDGAVVLAAKVLMASHLQAVRDV